MGDTLWPSVTCTQAPKPSGSMWKSVKDPSALIQRYLYTCIRMIRIEGNRNCVSLSHCACVGNAHTVYICWNSRCSYSCSKSFATTSLGGVI